MCRSAGDLPRSSLPESARDADKALRGILTCQQSSSPFLAFGAATKRSITQRLSLNVASLNVIVY
jgi:hypothetical protein